MKQRIPVRGGFYALADRHWSSQDLLNMISLPSESGATKTELSLIQAPGPRPFCEFGDGAIRGLRNVEGKLFAVAGNQLYQITSSAVAIPRGTIPGTGRVSMAHNQFGTANQLVIDNGSARYVYNTVTLVLEKVTDESFPGSFCAFYVDQYLGFVEPQGRYWGHSDLADALDYNSLDTYEAESDPDRIVWAHVFFREVLIFGRDTVEFFVNSPAGDGTAPFVRATNTALEDGLSAKFSVASMDSATFFLDKNRQVRELRGYTSRRISNCGVEEALAECTPSEISRAYAFVYEYGPHKIYYLTVPGRFTFGWDVLTQEWHRRSSPGRDDWRINELVFWEGVWIGGDRSSGRLYTLDWNYSFDGTEELVREWVSGSLFADQRRIEVNEIEVLASVGAPTEEADEFDIQPEGPSFEGDDLAWLESIGPDEIASYATAGDSAVLSYTVRDGAFPEGLTLATDGSLVGTAPATDGSGTVTVRVTDGNGLWADAEFPWET
jgi:hypothetical protein